MTPYWDQRRTAPISLSQLREAGGRQKRAKYAAVQNFLKRRRLQEQFYWHEVLQARGEPTCAAHPFPAARSENKLSKSPASNHFQLSRCDWGATPNLIWQGRTRWVAGLQRDSQYCYCEHDLKKKKNRLKKNTSITSWLSMEEKRGWPRATSIVRPLLIILSFHMITHQTPSELDDL